MEAQGSGHHRNRSAYHQVPNNVALERLNICTKTLQTNLQQRLGSLEDLKCLDESLVSTHDAVQHSLKHVCSDLQQKADLTDGPPLDVSAEDRRRPPICKYLAQYTHFYTLSVRQLQEAVPRVLPKTEQPAWVARCAVHEQRLFKLKRDLSSWWAALHDGNDDDKSGPPTSGLVQLKARMVAEMERMLRAAQQLEDSSKRLENFEKLLALFGDHFRSASASLHQFKQKVDNDTRYVWLAFLFFMATCVFIFMKRLRVIRTIFWTARLFVILMMKLIVNPAKQLVKRCERSMNVDKTRPFVNGSILLPNSA